MPERSVAGVGERGGLAMPGLTDRLGEVVQLLGVELLESVRGATAKLPEQRLERFV